MRFVRLILFSLLSVSAVAGSQPVQRKVVVLGSQAFSPRQISDLGRWLKGDAINLSEGAAVAPWSDQSGMGIDAAQGTSSKRPTYRASAINGMPGVQFDGVDDVLVLPINPTASHTIFVVASRTVTPTTYEPEVAYAASLVVGSGGDRGSPHYVKSDLTGAAYFPITTTPTFSSYDGAGSYSVNSPYLLEIVFQTGSPWFVYKNGVQEGTATASSFASDVVALQIGGQFVPGVTRPSHLIVSEVLVYTRTLSADERNRVRRYLSAKYTIATP